MGDDYVDSLKADLVRERFARRSVDKALSLAISERDALAGEAENARWVFDQALQEARAERDRLRAVVDAARAWRATRAMANLQRIADDPERAFDEAEAAVDALLRALDQLDVSPTMGDQG